MKSTLSLVLALALIISCKKKDESGPKIAVTGITVTPATVSLDVKSTQQLTATILPENASEKGVIWSSSDDKKATVSASGLVTAVGGGTATITATSVGDNTIKKDIPIIIKGDVSTALDTPIIIKGDVSIALGDEKYNLTALNEGTTSTVSNIPRTLAGNIKAMKVYITTTLPNAAIKAGGSTFTSGSTVDFTNPVTFTVTAGSTTRTYTVGITAYNADSNPYGIYTGKHLLNIREGNYGSSSSYLLMNDITLPPLTKEGATEIGDQDYEQDGFSSSYLAAGGKFDGGGHVIKNLICKSNLPGGSIGLFESISGTVQNLGVETGGDGLSSSKASSSAGILAGLVYSGAVIKNCYTKGKVSGGGMLGGVVGYMEYPCKIENTYSTADVTFSAVAYGGYGGGFLGRSKLADTGSGVVTNCFATGSVTGDGTKNKLGGFMGENNGSTFTSCYFPKSQSAGGAGISLPRPADSPATGFKPVAQSSFEGWDFTAKWKWVDGKWPQLRVFANQPDVDLPK